MANIYSPNKSGEHIPVSQVRAWFEANLSSEKTKNRLPFVDCHLYLSLLAYQCIHKIRSLLGQNGIDDSCSTIIKTLQTHIRETIYVESNTKSTLEKRITADPELSHLRIYNALNLDEKVGKTIKKDLIKHLINIVPATIHFLSC
jgi:hypothetical protein